MSDPGQSAHCSTSIRRFPFLCIAFSLVIPVHSNVNVLIVRHRSDDFECAAGTPVTPVAVFADDTKMYREIDKVSDHQQLPSDIDNLVTWSTTWSPLLNTQKCNTGSCYM